MNPALTAPKIDGYRRFLREWSRGSTQNSCTYDDRSYALIDELFSALHRVKPNANGVWELWLDADRGPIEDFGDVNEWIEDGAVDDAEGFKLEREACYPSEKVWYHFAAVEDKDSGYRAAFLGRKQAIVQDPNAPRGFSNDISEFVEWLLNSVKSCINALEAGTYNARVHAKLPFIHRTGTILRKDLWDIYPKDRAEFFRDLPRGDIPEFVEAMSAQPNDPLIMDGRIADMTADKFFSYCALGYTANNYTGSDLPPKEQYLKHADGRDSGLRDIDGSSPEAFAEWFLSRQPGAHPWEVCRGGNSTHISLFIHKDEGGWLLILAGSAWNRTVETVKFYLALKRAGLPVFVQDGRLLADRLLERERIGIVPAGVLPAYCESYFPNEHIIDFMNLPLEDAEILSKYVLWQEIKDAELAD